MTALVHVRHRHRDVAAVRRHFFAALVFLRSHAYTGNQAQELWRQKPGGNQESGCYLAGHN